MGYNRLSMSSHEISLVWERKTPDFTYESYDRRHQIRAAGGIEFTASSAPEFLGRAEFVNPEEMLAAAVSSCHMLTFLAICARSRIVVEAYEDEASALLEKRADDGHLAVTKVVLRPRIRFSGTSIPDAKKLEDLHAKAHRNCFVARSLACPVVVESRDA